MGDLKARVSACGAHSASFRLRVVGESCEPGSRISAVASRHGISASTLHRWRRQSVSGGVPAAVVVSGDGGSALEIWVAGMSLRLPADFDEGQAARALRAMRRAS